MRFVTEQNISLHYHIKGTSFCINECCSNDLYNWRSLCVLEIVFGGCKAILWQTYVQCPRLLFFFSERMDLFL